MTRTQCVRCHRTFPGRVLLADQAYCGECEQIMDREIKGARFAPGKRGTIVPDTGTEGEE